MCLHGRRRGRHQGSEGRWEAMRALSFRPFCPCDGRQVSLGDLSARSRYTTSLRHRTAPADVVLKRLAGGAPSDRLAKALTALGRVLKTLHI